MRCPPSSRVLLALQGDADDSQLLERLSALVQVCQLACSLSALAKGSKHSLRACSVTPARSRWPSSGEAMLPACVAVPK